MTNHSKVSGGKTAAGRTITGGITPLFLAAVLMMAAERSEATSYYVATNGTDVADGTGWATAWLTIGHAAATATNSGDVVTASNGTYTVSGTVTISKGVTLQSTNGYAVTTIQSSGGSFRMLTVSSNAVMDGFSVTGGNGGTGTIGLLDGSTLLNCRVHDNTGQFAAIFMADALVRNCLIDGHSGTYAGGIYMQASITLGPGTVENCTITGNSATQGGTTFAGGICFRNGKGIARNCIVYDNSNSAGGGRQNWGGNPTEFTFSCTTPDGGGDGIITSNPNFANAGSDDYSLQGTSPCVDSGTNLAWNLAGGAQDIDGNARIINGTVDMGAYEGGSVISVDFSADTTAGIAPLEVVFTSVAAGNTNGIYYRWSFTNVAVVDSEGTGLGTVTNTYGVGSHSVQLSVSNSSGDTVGEFKPDYISVGPATTYVSAASSPVYPYDTWATAANDIQTAIDVGADSTLVLVQTGLWVLASPPLDIVSGVHVKSLRGYTETTIDGNGTSLELINMIHASAIIDGFTFTGVNTASGAHGALDVHAGTLQNSHVTLNTTALGAIYLTSDNSVMRNCLINSNSGRYAGGVWISSFGTVENCTFHGNTGNEGSTGIWSGGVLFRSNKGHVRNCIIYNNTQTGGSPGNPNWGGGYTTFEHTCTVPAPATVGNITNDPQFVNTAAGGFSLNPNSPCVDSGTNLPWNLASDAVDITGDDRISNMVADMGAYEFQVPAGTIIMLR